MKRFYYLRDKQNKPRVTVCEATNDAGERAVGIAICSMMDNPCKKVGRAIAEGRARKAWIKKKTSGGVFRGAALDIMHEIKFLNQLAWWKGGSFAHKSQYIGV